MALKGVRPLEFVALRALDDDVGALWVALGVLGALLHARRGHAVEVAARHIHLGPGDRHDALRARHTASWEGDYDPRGVDIKLCFKKGAQLATAALTEHGMFSAEEVNYAGLAAAGATLLSPFPGEGRPGVKVGLRARAAQ